MTLNQNTMDFIEEYSTTDDVTDGLLTLYDECQEVGKPGEIGSGTVNTTIKKCTDLYWDDIPISSHPRFKDQEYLKHLKECAHDYSDKYLKGHEIVLYGNPKYQYYKKGEAFYGEHFDALNSTQIRVVAYITYLNTLTDGGGTYFTYQDHTVEAIKGKTVLFPPHYTHKHKGVVSLTQEKYIVTGWFTWK